MRLRRIFPNSSDGALDGAGDRLGLHVGKRHPHVLARAPGGDIAAHCARADDMDVFDLVAAAGEFLHLLAQENTRIRFCAVGVTISLANDAFSARSIAALSPPCFSQRSISA